MIIARRDFVSLGIVVIVPILVNAMMLFGGVASDPALLVAGFGTQLEWNPTRGYPTIDPNIGFISEALGRNVANSLAHGTILWWNPFEGLGTPIGESLSAAAMFPFSLLLALNNGVAIERCVLEIVAGLATWYLIRELGGSATAATLGAVAYSLNGTSCWLGTPWADTAPFLPLLILGIERLRRSALGGWALVAVALGLSILAGFPEIAYLYGLLAVGWALIRVWQSPQRLRFSVGLISSGLAGILIAAPALLAFADYLTVGYTGGHLAGAFANASLVSSGIPQVFLPYVWGPIFANPSQSVLWGNVGGYAGVGLCTLSIVALFGRQRRAIRILLFCWVVITLAATFNAPLAHQLVISIPLVKYTAYFRYLPTSWEFALAILAAFAVDDLRSYGLRASQVRIGFAVIVCFLSVAWSLFAGGISLISAPNAEFRSWIFHSLEAAILILIAMAASATVRKPNLRAALLAVVIISENAGYYLMTVRSYPKSGVLDMTAVTYLQHNLGYQRFYTLGPIAPNYGSYFKIASINHNDLPVPNAWITYIRKNLDPYTDGINFVGFMPFAGPGVPSRTEELRVNLPGYERAGVRFVVSPGDQNPFVPAFELPASAGPQTATDLKRSTTISFRVTGTFAPASLSGIDVLIGNYRGTADGTLHVRVCDTQGVCTSGDRALRDSADNRFFHIDMHHPMTINPPVLVVTLTNPSNKYPVAFWTYPSMAGSSTVSIDGQPALAEALRVRFDFVAKDALPQRVFHDQTLSIFELPHPRPYFEAPGCQLASTERTELEATCSAAADLRRLELLMPGWHATINGKPAEIKLFDDTFQSIRLPAGRSTVNFWFFPPFVQYGFAALTASLIAVIFSLWREWRRSAVEAPVKLQGARLRSP